MKKISLFLLSYLLLTGCTEVESSLEQALQQSGKNRIHLEQVLKHYSKNLNDSLKFKAACFLIENMPGHGWYEGEELRKYRLWIDSTYHDRNFVFKAILYEAFFHQAGATIDLKRQEDIEHLDSSFLIKHIDYTFEAIARRPWLTELTFEQLCEYILPYRVGNEPPALLHTFQDSLFNTDMIGLLKYDDITSNASGLFSSYYPELYSSGKQEIIICYRGKNIKFDLADCINQTIIRSWWGKVLVFPIATDFNPAFPNRNDRHSWSVMIDNSHLNSISSLTFEAQKKGKLYRNTFSRNPVPDSSRKEYIPSFFRSPFRRDVTALYAPVKDIEVKSHTSNSAFYGYLCVFNDLKWTPVAYGEMKKNSCYFKDVGIDVLYLPVIYPDYEAKAFSWPFILNIKGEMEQLEPDTGCLKTIRLRRKYPLRYQTYLLNREFTNAIIEASNDPSFRRFESLGTFETITEEQWASAGMKVSHPYRYWRIRSKSFFTIAECRLFISPGEEAKPLLMDGNRPQLYYTGFDNNPLSYAYPDQNFTFGWDMGKAVSLSEIECLLCNDGNNIWPGHWYQLNYYDGEGWCSLGTQKATDKFIEFSGVPENTLLWLQNLTAGKEERIFTYRKGKIQFW